MKKFGILALVFFISSMPALANSISSTDNSYWQCSATDNENKQWQATSVYERSAATKALDNCKKHSIKPVSCKTAKETCEYFANGISTRPMWRCTALDLMAKSWVSNIYAQRDDAAIAAREYCKERSGMPDTCYINLLTCKNLNERN